MFIPAWFISIASFCLRLVGGLAARQRRTGVTVLFHLFLHILFVGIFVLYADLLWTKLPPYDMFPNARDIDFWDSFWWLTLAWWSVLVSATLLWKADIQRPWLRWGIIALTVAYPVLQIVYATPIFTWKPGKTPWVRPEWDMVEVWNGTQAVIAAAFWVTLLSLLLRCRWQAEKEKKAAQSLKLEAEQPSE